MFIAHILNIIALWATSTVNSTPSNVFLALVLVIHCPCICYSSSGAVSTGASSTSARSTVAGKSRVFGANFLGQKIDWCYIFGKAREKLSHYVHCSYLLYYSTLG